MNDEPTTPPDLDEDRVLQLLDLQASAGFLRVTANLIEQLVEDDRDGLIDILSAPMVRDDERLARCVYVAREALSDLIIEYGLTDSRRDESPGGEVT